MVGLVSGEIASSGCERGEWVSVVVGGRYGNGGIEWG